MSPKTGKTVRTVRTVRNLPVEPNPPDAAGRSRTQPGRKSDAHRTQAAEQIPRARAISDGPDGSDGCPGSSLDPTGTILAVLTTNRGEWLPTRTINWELGFVANDLLGELHSQGLIERQYTAKAVTWRRP